MALVMRRSVKPRLATGISDRTSRPYGSLTMEGSVKRFDPSGDVCRLGFARVILAVQASGERGGDVGSLGFGCRVVFPSIFRREAPCRGSG